ncbi:MAG: hypothetical protein IPO06_07415 [Leptospiraceae bacterium]|nr:hypothetical protein [Leptospiraceae bacterium]
MVIYTDGIIEAHMDRTHTNYFSEERMIKMLGELNQVDINIAINEKFTNP